MENQAKLTKGYVTSKDGRPSWWAADSRTVRKTRHWPLSWQNTTVYNYDRRGRGQSGDTKPYAIAREVDDIDALITEAGGSACTGTDAQRSGVAEWVLALGPAADALAKAIPHAAHRTLEGQSQVAGSKVVTPLLRQFFRHM